MFVRYRTVVSRETAAVALGRRRRTSPRRGTHGEKGAALVEFALVVPLMMIIVFGITSYGFLFNQFLSVTEATNIGGQQLARSRGTYSDPCAQVATDVLAASPYLKSANTAFSFTFGSGGTAQTFAAGTSPTCTSEFAVLNAVNPASGTVYPVTLQVTYSCVGAISFNFGKLYMFNPLPAASCKLSSQITEILQ